MVAPLAPFDDDLVATVADEHDVDPASLRAVLEAHQALFRSFGERSVSDVIYEWRTGLAGDPLVARTETSVYLDAPEHAWADLIARLDLADDDAEAVALRTVHARQFAADRGEATEGAVVVARE